MTDKKRINNKKTILNNKLLSGFTIIELIVVIVIIGILASIAIVSYNGIQAKARDNSVLSDLENMDALQTSYGLSHNVSGKAYYSGSGYDADLEFTPSEGNVIDVVINGTDYCIRGYNPGSSKKSIDDTFIKESTEGICGSIPPSSAASGIIAPTPPETVVVGAQTWMKYNINDGTMVSGGTTQAAGQKWCYENLEDNCTTYGALYEWDAIMNGSTTEGARGICPEGFHIPTKVELENLLIPTPYSSLLVGGASGFDMRLSGDYYLASVTNDFENKDLEAWFWTSTLDTGEFPGWAWFSGYNQLGATGQYSFVSGPTGSGASLRCKQD